MSGIHDEDLDSRVRAALHARAGQVALGPDGESGAWEQTVSRKWRARGLTSGGNRGGRTRRWAAPLAAAASVAAIGAGIGIAASFHSAGPGTVASPSYSATAIPTVPGLPGPNLKRAQPITQVVLVKQEFGTSTSWTYVWFANVGWFSDKGKTLVACADTYESRQGGTPQLGAQGCTPIALGGSMLAPFGYQLGEPAPAFDQLGVALRRVTSVAIQSDTDKNQKVQGSLIDGRGFPYKVFMVTFPAKTNLTQWKLVAHDADGKQDSVPFPVATAF